MAKQISKARSALLAQAREVISIEERALAETRRRLDTGFITAVELIKGARGRVVVIGVGKSGLIGRKLAATLTSTGTSAVFMHPAEAMHGDLGMITPDDVVLALSFSGEAQELRDLLPYIKERHALVIGLTGKKTSRLAKASDCVLAVSVSREACPFNITPTASTTAMLALGDALAIALMRAKGFKKEDFARLHPAGSLGRRLNLRAKDIMHTGKENPVVHSKQTLKEALFMMTKTRRGATSIVDGKGRIAGYLTDGDLRRILDRGGTLALNAPVSWVMTKDPFSIKEETTLEGVLEVFKLRNFDTIPVVDDRLRPIGIIDERDLL